MRSSCIYTRGIRVAAVHTNIHMHVHTCVHERERGGAHDAELRVDLVEHSQEDAGGDCGGGGLTVRSDKGRFMWRGLGRPGDAIPTHPHPHANRISSRRRPHTSQNTHTPPTHPYTHANQISSRRRRTLPQNTRTHTDAHTRTPHTAHRTHIATPPNTHTHTHTAHRTKHPPPGSVRESASSTSGRPSTGSGTRIRTLLLARGPFSCSCADDEQAGCAGACGDEGGRPPGRSCCWGRRGSTCTHVRLLRKQLCARV